jgi:hypothetical protein
MKRVFLYMVRGSLIVTEKRLPPPAELLSSFATPQACGKFAEKNYRGMTITWETKRFKGLTEDGRRRIAEAKRGDRHPLAKGMPEKTKRKISRTMKGTREASLNPFYGRKHRAITKMKIGNHRRGSRFRWVTDPEGREHQVPLDFVLPVGWINGRARRVARTV